MVREELTRIWRLHIDNVREPPKSLLRQTQDKALFQRGKWCAPLEKGDRGRFLAIACRQQPQIPLSPPFPKGEMVREELTRIWRLHIDNVREPPKVPPSANSGQGAFPKGEMVRAFGKGGSRGIFSV